MKNEIIRNAVEMALKKGAKAEVFYKGTKATTESEADFIKNTNAKYYHTESAELLGDFINITLIDGSFIRLSVDTLTELGVDNMQAYIDDQFNYADTVGKKAESIISQLEEYNLIKDRLIIRPLNLKLNRYTLENMVYKEFGDIALVLYAVVLDDKDNNCLNTIKIPNEIFKKWNLDFEEVFKATLLNTNSFAMPRMYKNLLNISNTSDAESALMSTDYIETSLKAETIPLVTTTRKTNGAIALFYPGVKEKIAEMFGDSFYVAFTSIHEAMVHKRGTIDPVSIKRHIKATNQAFGPEETLSDEVYFYDANTGEFTVA